MPDNAYQWNATVNILQGGYDNPLGGKEIHGADPEGVAWQQGENSGSHTAVYYYADSNAQNSDGTWGDNANSSQIFITATDKWTARVDDDNNLTITLNTVIESIKRGKIVGNPNKTITNGRDIVIRRYSNGPNLWSASDGKINEEKTLATNINLGTETFILKPGASASRSSLYILNHTAGVSWETPGSTDEMEAGVAFRNNLPADYVPGAVFNGIQWGTCNSLTKGACKVYNGSGWTNCRTTDGHIKSDNPPFCYSDGQYRNMYKIPNQY